MSKSDLIFLKTNISESYHLKNTVDLIITDKITYDPICMSCEHGCPGDCYYGCIDGCKQGCRTFAVR